MRIVILTRGSKEEGLGHLVRAQAFAKAAQARHRVEIIAIASAELLPSAYCVANEVDACRKLAVTNADLIVYDIAALEQETFDIAQAIAPVSAAISPVFPYIDKLDMFFTRGAAPEKNIGRVKVYAGLTYAILSRDCMPIPADRYQVSLNSPVLSVGIAMGGGDKANNTLHVLQALGGIQQQLAIKVFIGSGYEHSIDTLKHALPDQHHLIVIESDNMWKGLQDCAVGIFSSGLSILEAVYAGLPVIKITREDDASNAVRNAYDDLLLNGGRFADVSYLERLTVIIEGLQANREILKECRLRQQGLVDGRGAERVMQEIEKFCLAKLGPRDKITL